MAVFVAWMERSAIRGRPSKPKSRISLRSIQATCQALIRQRKGLAPAVLADLTLDYLAGVRPFKQRAQSAAVNAVRRVLILRLLPRHFVRRACLPHPKHQ